MKKIVATLALISLFMIPLVSLAAPVEQKPIPAAPFEDIGGLMGIINNIGNWIFTGLLAFAAIFLIIAGYNFLTSSGDPIKAAKARQMVINALIGVGVGLAARGLIAVIENILKV